MKTATTGTSVSAPALINNASVAIDSATMQFLGPVTGTGQMSIETGVTLDIAGALGAGQQIAFAGTSGPLNIDSAPNFAGVIAGLGAGMTIDLTGFAYSATTSIAFTPNASSGGVVGLTNGATIVRLNLANNESLAGFTQTTDGHGGTPLRHT